ncbi:hypothetical protein [Clostridium felsineum]|uniref:Uncharacterized protein n=1 Tax=Clostridium felsineum TaxID=36839 RepID=A0A1S8L4I7_9CLOT|nr:hypothetical protein [Clostridium felsineum]URZ06789.1 hypothetical protein CLROS_021220 [Clostridium felsineum]URZ11821.1 hypothetical protein CROST_025380 [Clostridium felsineum]
MSKLKDYTTIELIEEIAKRQDYANIYTVEENEPYYVLMPSMNKNSINKGKATIIEINGELK